MTNITPTDDRILVKVDDPETVSKGGVILSVGSQERQTEGVVQAIGPRVSDEIAVGDRILFTKYGGYATEVGEEDVVFLRETDVLAVVS